MRASDRKKASDAKAVTKPVGRAYLGSASPNYCNYAAMHEKFSLQIQNSRARFAANITCRGIGGRLSRFYRCTNSSIHLLLFYSFKSIQHSQFYSAILFQNDFRIQNVTLGCKRMLSERDAISPANTERVGKKAFIWLNGYLFALFDIRCSQKTPVSLAFEMQSCKAKSLPAK